VPSLSLPCSSRSGAAATAAKVVLWVLHLMAETAVSTAHVAVLAMLQVLAPGHAAGRAAARSGGSHEPRRLPAASRRQGLDQRVCDPPRRALLARARGMRLDPWSTCSCSSCFARHRGQHADAMLLGMACWAGTGM
jgi:hypothetical protein